MTHQELARRLDAIPETDSGKLETLAAELLAGSRESPKSAAHLWSDPRAQASGEKTTILLGALEETALLPLLEIATELSPQQTTWLLRTAVADLIPLRTRLFARLERALSDIRPVPMPPSPIRPESATPGRRVCDEAYLLARQFFNLEESKAQYFLNEKSFLHHPESLRDDEIKKVRASRVWTQFVEDIGP